MFKNNPPDSLKSFNCNKMKNVLKATKIRRNKDSHKVKQLRNAKKSHQKINNNAKTNLKTKLLSITRNLQKSGTKQLRNT